MRRTWAAVAAVWALLAIVAVLAWGRQQNVLPVSQGATQTLVVKGPHGTRRLVVLAPSHATTSSSGTPQAAGPAVQFVSASHATTGGGG